MPESNSPYHPSVIAVLKEASDKLHLLEQQGIEINDNVDAIWEDMTEVIESDATHQ